MTTSNKFLFFVFFLFLVVSFAEDHAYVKLTTGKIRGYSVEPKSFGSHRVNIFKGVPFTEPPVGHLRFKLPRPAKPWFGVLDTTEYKPACPSNTSRTTSPQYYISEDCLYMNILADATCIFSGDCPTLVIYHGGGFYYDSAIMQNIDFLTEHYASKGIIVVIPAYRLGTFGFLEIEDSRVIPRNLGFHDIVIGLKWIQKEISNFGGDPDKVTLFGNSGGASIITLLSVAPGVEKMWDKTIISSPKTYMTKRTNRNVSVEILKGLGCWSDRDSNATLFPYQQFACLNNRSMEEIMGVQRLVDDAGITYNGPVYDSLIFYGQTYTELIDEFKPSKTLLGGTTHEFHVKGEDIPDECQDLLAVFDYSSDQVFDACLDKYLEEYENGTYSDISAEGIRSELFRIASVVSKKFHPAFMYSFELEGYNFHTDDSRFSVGIHPMLNISKWKEDYMLIYWPSVIERFIKYGVPDEDWPPFDHGSNYKVIDVSNSSGTFRGPYSIRNLYFPESIKTWLVDFKMIDDTVKYEEFKNKTKEAMEKWIEIREQKWERFQEKWKELQEALREKYENWKETRKNATIEIFKKYKKAKEIKLEEQRFKMKQFVNYLLSDSIEDVIEKIDELEEFLSPGDSEKFAILENVKDKLKLMLRELVSESLSPEDKEKIELKTKIKQAIKDTVDDYINGKKEENGITVDNVTEFTITDPRIESLTKEEWEAAKQIFEEQRAALQDAKTKIEKDRPNVDQKVDEAETKVKAAMEELRNATFAKFEERLSERKQWKSVFEELRNETFSKIFEKLKTIAQEKYAENQEKFEKMKQVLDEVKAKIKEKITQKIIEKELGLFQGSFVALPPALQENGGIDQEAVDALTHSKLENRRLWSAFWIVVLIAFLLTFVLFVKSCLNLIERRPRRGYFYNEDPGFFNFNEKSKIVVANYPSYT